MTLRWGDRVLETSTSTGTGAFTLAAAVTGYRRFSGIPSISTSDTVYYSIFAVDGSGNPSGDWETGLGTYSSANTLTRTTPLQSSNGGSAVNFAAGTKYVMCCPPSAVQPSAFAITLLDDADAATARSTLGINSTNVKLTECFIVACSDETTALTTGTAKVTFRMPYAFTLSAVRASVTTAQSSGSILTVDINEGGTTILSTKLTIDNNEKTSTTAATAAVISDSSLADDAEMTVDIDQVGTGGTGLKIYLIGSRT